MTDEFANFTPCKECRNELLCGDLHRCYIERKKISDMHPANRLRLMAGYPLLPEDPTEESEIQH